MNSTTLLKGYGNAGRNHYILANNVKTIVCKSSILADDTRKMITAAYIELCFLLSVVLINSIVLIVHTIGVGITDVEVYKIIIRAISAYNNLKVFISGLSYRVGTNVRKCHCRIHKGEVRISESFATVGVDGNVHVACHTTTVVERNVQANGFAGVNHTIAVVCRADRGTIVDGIIVQINLRLRNLSQRLVNIGYRVRTVSFFGEIVVRIQCTGVHNLRLNELSRVHFTIRIIRTKQCSNTGNSRSCHRSTVQACILVTRPA